MCWPVARDRRIIGDSIPDHDPGASAAEPHSLGQHRMQPSSSYKQRQSTTRPACPSATQRRPSTTHDARSKKARKTFSRATWRPRVSQPQRITPNLNCRYCGGAATSPGQTGATATQLSSRPVHTSSNTLEDGRNCSQARTCDRIACKPATEAH